MHVTPLVWALTIGFVVAVIVLDLLLADRRPHRISTKEAGLWVGLYVGLAVLFGIGIGLISGWTYGGEFFAGYLTELSLSVDNLFVFVIILAAFAVPEIHQHKVLLYGIVIALILRAILIVLGAAVIERFSSVFYLFGVFLIYTAIKLVKSRNDTPEPGDNKLLRRVEKFVPTTQDYHGTKLIVKLADKRVVTPMFLVMIAIGTTDILFALDSIPAIFGLTQAAFFLLHGLLHKLIYLSIGLAVILGFIGVKMILHALHETTGDTPEIPLALSLGFIVVTLIVTAVASLWAVRRNPELAHTVGMAADAEKDAERLMGDELKRLQTRSDLPKSEPTD